MGGLFQMKAWVALRCSAVGLHVAPNRVYVLEKETMVAILALSDEGEHAFAMADRREGDLGSLWVLAAALVEELEKVRSA
jgi:hypothetical protein